MRKYGNVWTTKDRDEALRFEGTMAEAEALADTYERKLHDLGFKFFVEVCFANYPAMDSWIFHVCHTGEAGFDPTFLARDDVRN